MRRPKGYSCHTLYGESYCWTPEITGDPMIDESIKGNNSKVLARKLPQYLSTDKKGGPKTQYDYYNGYGLDD